MAERLIGPQPIIGPGDSPSTVGGNAPMTEYAPMDEAARRAIFGVNPATGRAYTDAESAAANAGYNPYAGAVGYQIDPRTGNLNVLFNNGSVATTGARYQTTASGYIVPQESSRPAGYGFDEEGNMYNPGQRMPGESMGAWIQRLSALGPGVIFDNGKAIQYDASGRFYTEGESQPPGFGMDRPAGIDNVAGGATGTGAFVMGTGTATTADGKPLPGTAAFTGFQERESAYNLLYEQMAAYGLQALVEPLRNLVLEGVSPSEFTIRLRDTDAYKKRFAANQSRIQRGLRALSEAEYIGLEDQYQSIMRNYGLPASYYQRGDMGRQEGFEKFIAGDVSAAELEDRIQTAQNRVINAAPEVARTLRDFYPGITNGDILAYTLDPDKALTEIRRKVTAAEIGAGAAQAGLPTSVTRAEELGRYGVTADQARAGFQQVAQILPRGSQLSEFYQKQGVSPYTQTTAEQEVFGIPGAVEAQRQRRKLTELETAAFSGQAGITSGALARDRAGAF